MYQDVLVPTDGSDGIRRAITRALEPVDAFDGTVHALAVVTEGPCEGLASEGAHGGAGRAARRAVERVETEADRRDVAVERVIRPRARRGDRPRGAGGRGLREPARRRRAYRTPASRASPGPATSTSTPSAATRGSGR